MRRRAATWNSDDLLDLLEPGWASRLRGRSLVAEAEPETEVLKAVARTLGAYPADIAAQRWPACLAFAVTGIAAAAHHGSSPWRTWWLEGGKRSPAAAGIARHAGEFRKALASLGLSAGTDLNDDELLLHTGVPDAFLVELCKALADENADGAIANGPVALLLRHEPADAGPLLSTCRRSLKALIADEEPRDGGPPRRFAEAIAAFRARDRPAARRTGSEWRLEVFGRGLLVRRPDGDLAPPTAADAPPAVGGDIRVIAYGQLPPSWSGWHLVHVLAQRI